MSALAANWSQWSAKFAALTRRERVIVAFAVVFGGAFLLYGFAVEPLLLKARAAGLAEVAARTELAEQQAKLALLTAQNADPDAGSRQRLAQVKQELATVGGRLATFESGMVPPARMQAFLEGILARRSIELLGLKTLPVTQVGTSGTTEPASGKGKVAADPAPVGGEGVGGEGIYQHGMEIRLAGSYNDLLGYLAELERMPQQLMWNSVSFSVEKYPRNVMVLRVYTLSLDRNWLVV